MEYRDRTASAQDVTRNEGDRLLHDTYYVDRSCLVEALHGVAEYGGGRAIGLPAASERMRPLKTA